MSGGRLLEASGDRRRRLMVEAPPVGVQNPAYTVCAEISVPAAGRDPCGRNFFVRTVLAGPPEFLLKLSEKVAFMREFSYIAQQESFGYLFCRPELSS